MLPCYHGHIGGLAWNCSGSSADTLELLQSCVMPSMSVRKLLLYVCCHVTMVILMALRGIVVAPVLMHWSCCSLALCQQWQYASCFIQMLPCYHGHIGGLAWNCSGSSADTLELLQSCVMPSMSVRKLLLYVCCHVTMVILMALRGIVVAPVLMHWSCSSLALCHQCQYASYFIHMLPCYHGYIDGLAWNCGSSSADALELLQFCAVPPMSVRKLLYTYVAMLSWSYWWLGVELW